MVLLGQQGISLTASRLRVCALIRLLTYSTFPPCRSSRDISRHVSHKTHRHLGKPVPCHSLYQYWENQSRVTHTNTGKTSHMSHHTHYTNTGQTSPVSLIPTPGKPVPCHSLYLHLKKKSMHSSHTSRRIAGQLLE